MEIEVRDQRRNEKVENIPPKIESSRPTPYTPIITNPNASSERILTLNQQPPSWIHHPTTIPRLSVHLDLTTPGLVDDDDDDVLLSLNNTRMSDPNTVSAEEADMTFTSPLCVPSS